MSNAPSPVVRLSHVCLNSDDLEKTEAFYCGLLGFQTIHQFVNAAGERYGFILAAGGGTFLEFFLTPPALAGKPHESRNFRHLCFQVEDIEATARIFRDQGMDVAVTIGKTDLVPQFWVTDPDGNPVEFHAYDNPASPQFPYV